MCTLHSFVTLYLLVSWSSLLVSSIYFCVYTFNIGSCINQDSQNKTLMATCIGSPLVYDTITTIIITTLTCTNVIFTLSHLFLTEKSTTQYKTTLQRNIQHLRDSLRTTKLDETIIYI